MGTLRRIKADITMFPGIFQVYKVILELVFYVPFSIPIIAQYLGQIDVDNLPFYSLHNTVEQ